ncbi:hypothetical protein [Porticoccus hydrocarbonoclasticus]|uniref:hypothetical protein n=1 Tax=Porticoccus hydrocarbonoclasticus TaxID=1073414 RepID=UPI001268C897|nr:hypothetical protein [Porticoccus hydrocarbonoclasticus]
MSVTKTHWVLWIITAFLLSVLVNTAHASLNSRHDISQRAELSHSAAMPCESESAHPAGVQHANGNNHSCMSDICHCVTQGCHLTPIGINPQLAWVFLPHHPAQTPLRQNLLNAGPHRLDRPPRS